MSKNESIEERGNRTPLLFVGSLSVLIAVAASGILAATKLGYIQSLPGCGVGSGCDSVTNGPWGVVPIIGWPVSFLGFAWFVALFCGWIKSSGGSKSLLWLIRAGILGSLGFVILMASIGHFCKWCMLAHACNLVFWCITELIHRSRTSGVSASCFLTAVLPAFVATSIGLIVALQFVPALGERVDESTLPLLEARHRIGPENAPIQIVMFTDYQCPDCYRLEKRLAELVETSGDVSVSVKHFPLNYDCNDNIGLMKMHSNACWAARAAEAASIVGGEEGWEKMHEWLFTQKGSFTDDSIHRSLVELGFNPREFIRVMTSEETLQRVQQDADDGFGLGIYFTPMIFVNGVEYLWYYGGQGTLLSAVDSIRSGLKGGSADVVPPPSATDKLLEDWQRGRRFSLPDHGNRAWLGGGDIEVVVWGDYQSSTTSRLNTEIKTLLERDSRIKYS
ncbi:MAG TPA: hypothetical protein EYM64_02255, partial [Phycisphaerales bacterium]|nr:hypothetical protein [Phycisphaerales bacterium]